MAAPIEVFVMSQKFRILCSKKLICKPNQIQLSQFHKHRTVEQSYSKKYLNNLLRWSSNAKIMEYPIRSIPLPFSESKRCYMSSRYATSSAAKKCWKCGRPTKQTELFFCECGVVQSVADVDYFQLMGLEQSFDIDNVLLSTKLKDLQKLLHPDKYSLKSEEEKLLSEQQSSMINKAYSTLSKPLNRALYMLELYGQPLEEDNSDVNQGFLMDIMEINEQLAEIDSVEKMRLFQDENNSRLDECHQLLSKAFTKGDITEAKNVVIKLKYFSNIDDKIKEFYQRNAG